MNLTDNENRNILSHFDSGKPLPYKYRFLLFEDKHEVKCVWNRKANDITKVVLPFQVIEQVDEPHSKDHIKIQLDLFNSADLQLKSSTNKPIWSDNKLILSSLKRIYINTMRVVEVTV